jgi:nucleoside-diphosphate-sugar epimerase
MENNSKKILITGAAGLIGREMCALLSKEFDVVAVDNNFRYPDFQPNNCSYIQSDIEDYLSKVDNDFDYVFHLSAINGTAYFYQIPNQLIENNIKSDLAIFNFMKKNSKSKLIYASSSEVIAGSDEYPTPELTDISIKNIHNPRWSYRISKMLSENYLVNSNINYLIIRFFNVYGKSSGSGHFFKDILDNIAIENYKLMGQDETRSFCRVEDAADALVNIFKIADNEIVNIGSDEEITILEAANIIADCLGKRIDWQSIPSKQGSVLRRKPCLKKLKSLYPSFNPKTFKQSINEYFTQ